MNPRDYRRDLIKAFAELFDEMEPTTPDEIDEILRDEGYDPEQLAERIVAAVIEEVALQPVDFQD